MRITKPATIPDTTTRLHEQACKKQVSAPKAIRLVALAVLLLAACAFDSVAQTTARPAVRGNRNRVVRRPTPQERIVRRAERRGEAIYTNPTLAGDYPDPSVIRVGNDYYATATSSEWAPEFPLLHSRDLVNWEVIGAVFQRRPAWSVGNYWAPEIAEDRGRFYVYYTARRKPQGMEKEGPLCVAVATAPRPTGPYTDRGPMICQDAGSIDGFPIRDENGRRYLVWKYDGNSRNKPTPLYAQPMNEEGTKLTGQMREILTNDQPWEAQLVEGAYIMRRNGYFYMFYAGNACCTRDCNYAMGVARSRKLLGPWEKSPANPIVAGNSEWKCPGHGSVVSDASGRDYMMYHAYHPRDTVYVGRQAVLDTVEWTADGWVTINGGRGVSGRAISPFGVRETNREYTFLDEFTAPVLRPGWQWIQSNEPVMRVNTARGGRLVLSPNAMARRDDMIGGVVGWWTTTGDYVATTELNTRNLGANEYAGLGAYGDMENALGVVVGSREISLYRREKNSHQVIDTVALPRGRGATIHLRMNARGGNRYQFAASRDGVNYEDIGAEQDGSYLPPWDRGVRVVLTSGGSPVARATFENLRITSSNAGDNAARVQ